MTGKYVAKWILLPKTFRLSYRTPPVPLLVFAVQRAEDRELVGKIIHPRNPNVSISRQTLWSQSQRHKCASQSSIQQPVEETESGMIQYNIPGVVRLIDYP